MAFNVNKYRPRKKRTLFDTIRVCFKLYKRKFRKAWMQCDNEHVYKIHQKLKTEYSKENVEQTQKQNVKLENTKFNQYWIGGLFAFLVMAIIVIIDFINPNLDGIMGVVFIIFSIVCWLLKGIAWIFAIIFILGMFRNSLYNFAEKIFNELYAKRQETVSNNYSSACFNSYASVEVDTKELEKYRNEIMQKDIYPTAETISITIYPQIYNILLYFFPNSFKTDVEAYEYYKNFCERAEQLGEEETVYKYKKLLDSGIHIDIRLNMLSGERTVINYFYNNDSLCTMFNFFSYNELKNLELKKEIEQLYRNNWEFLESIGMCYAFSWGDISVTSRLDVTPYGLDFYLPDWADFHKFQFWFSKNRNIFQLPTENIICAFRECATYYLKEEECQILGEKIKSQNYKDVIFKELDFVKKHAEICNKFIHIYMDIEYFTPAEIVTNFATNRKYKYIDTFIMSGYRGA